MGNTDYVLYVALDRWFTSSSSYSILAVLAILLLIATFVVACLVMQNFGRGLKTQSKSHTQAMSPTPPNVPLVSKNKEVRRGKSMQIHRGPMATHPNRMSIE